ncbi:MAG: hypothetical protein JOY80_04295 [Candidatus Dormibacteraeota bacterium]|nr:hypothetical protein [Candidatus Dormibacteraeota bacterium]
MPAVVLLLVACGSPANSSASPSVSAVPAQGGDCVTKDQATQIWHAIDMSLNAIEADPKHAGASAVTTGTALQMLQRYVSQMLEANGWTEHEVDRLDSLAVLSAGCGNATLQLRVSVTVVQDDYLRSNGTVDHHDPEVGMTMHFVDSYERSAGAWKESDFQDLDQPSPSATPELL